jgi:aspartate racemase
MVEPDLRRGLNPHFFRISLKLYPNCQDNRCHFGVVRSLVDFLVIPSNFPHVIEDQIEQIAGKPLLSIIEVTIAEVQRCDWQRVGVLGLGEPTVYTVPLAELGLACETLGFGLRERLDEQILLSMEGREDTNANEIAQKAVNSLRERSVDGIILGCTEIPLLLGKLAAAEDLINPAELLAEAAIRHAIE